MGLFMMSYTGDTLGASGPSNDNSEPMGTIVGPLDVSSQKNACNPVCARPRMSAWTSWVPS